MRQLFPLPLGRGARVFRRSVVVSGIGSPSVRKRTRFVADPAADDNPGRGRAGMATAREGLPGAAPGERSPGWRDRMPLGLVVVGLGDVGSSLLAGVEAARAHLVHPWGSLVEAGGAGRAAEDGS